jgi:hypothetical protein
VEKKSSTMRPPRTQRLLTLIIFSKPTQADFQEHVSYTVFMNLVTSSGSGGVLGRRTRCSDRFVRYPYPPCTMSQYQKEYMNKINHARLLTEEDAFNLEKETRIINPHPMELSTTHKTTFTPFKVMPPKRELRPLPKSDAPA